MKGDLKDSTEDRPEMSSLMVGVSLTGTHVMDSMEVLWERKIRGQ